MENPKKYLWINKKRYIVNIRWNKISNKKTELK